MNVLGFRKIENMNGCSLSLDTVLVNGVPDGVDLLIEGWCYNRAGGKEILRIFSGNTEIMPQTYNVVERKDLKKVFPDMVSADCGFRLQGHFSEEDADKKITLAFSDSAETEPLKIYQGKLSELRGDPQTDILVDNIYLWHDDEVHLSGWAVCFPDKSMNPEMPAFYITSNKGSQISFDFERSIRSDINQKYLINRPDYESGFLIRFKFGQEYHYTLSAEFGGNVKKFNIDIEELFIRYRENMRHFRNSLDMKIHADDTLKKDDAYLRSKYGYRKWREIADKRFRPTDPEYDRFRKEHNLSREEILRERKEAEQFPAKPVISIVVPVYRTPVKYLIDMIRSCMDQTYPYWQLAIANGDREDREVCRILRRYRKKDSRIVYKDLDRNLGIAGNTNAAMELADGDFLAFLDHDDMLAPNALYENVRVILQHDDADVIYSDEDKFAEDKNDHFEPAFKPDFNPDLLCSNNYICHFLVVRKKVVQRTGGFLEEYDGAQDFDFVLRCTEIARHVYHIPRVLYWWRCHNGSTAVNPESKMYAYEAGRKAVEAHQIRSGYDNAEIRMVEGALGYYDTIYPVRDYSPAEILVLNKGKDDDLRRCLESIETMTEDKTWHVTVVEPGDNEAAALNKAVKAVDRPYIVFMHSDMEILTKGWLPRLLGDLQHKDTCAVGIKTFYRNNTVEHCGYTIGLGGFAGRIMEQQPSEAYGRFSRAIVQQDVSAVSSECMIVERKAFESIGGFDEQLRNAYYDIDLCLKMETSGYGHIMLEPNVQAYHYCTHAPELVRHYQRGITEDAISDTGAYKDHLHSEDIMKKKWKSILQKGDPFLNLNWSRVDMNFAYRFAEDNSKEYK